MRYRITRIVPEHYRGFVPGEQIHTELQDVLPSSTELDALVDNVHYVVIERVPDELQTKK